MPHKPLSKLSSPDAIDLLAEDHKKILKMFSEFQKMRKDDSWNEDAKQDLVERACTELTIHSQVEQEIFYPALRAALEGDTSLLDEAEVEHMMAHQLITELESMQPDDKLYDARFTVLGEYVRHRIEEEQEKIFPRARKSKLDLELLGEEMRYRKEELCSEFGLPEKNAEAVQDARPQAATRRAGSTRA